MIRDEKGDQLPDKDRRLAAMPHGLPFAVPEIFSELSLHPQTEFHLFRSR